MFLRNIRIKTILGKSRCCMHESIIIGINILSAVYFYIQSHCIGFFPTVTSKSYPNINGNDIFNRCFGYTPISYNSIFCALISSLD